MDKNPENHTAPPTAAVVQELPGRIVKGHCSSCGADLSALADEILSNEEQQKFHCTGCGIQLRIDLIELQVWQCGFCHARLIKFGQDTHCNGCGRELIYPEGTTTKK